MASIKLGSLLSMGSGFLKNALASQQSKAVAQDLLKTSKLELEIKALTEVYGTYIRIYKHKISEI